MLEYNQNTFETWMDGVSKNNDYIQKTLSVM